MYKYIFGSVALFAQRKLYWKDGRRFSCSGFLRASFWNGIDFKKIPLYILSRSHVGFVFVVLSALGWEESGACWYLFVSFFLSFSVGAGSGKERRLHGTPIDRHRLLLLVVGHL